MGIRDELRFVRDYLPAVRALRPLTAGRELTVADVLEDAVDANAGRPALISDGVTSTYADLDELANRVAHHFTTVGVGRGDVVALDMENRTEFVAIWFGLAKIGATTALINTNLTGTQLAHCINVAAPAHLVIGAEMADHLASARSELDSAPTVWAQGGAVDGAEDLDAALSEASNLRPAKSSRAGMTLGDSNLFFIYTSGTTGLPKAAKFSHLRFLTTAIGGALATKLTPDDRHYLCLPLYHTAGGCMALGATLTSGASAVLVPKFSARKFWADAVEHRVTAFQYIGELVRYLVNTEPVPQEKQHSIRVIIGNGLRPELWDDVLGRFGIAEVKEFYGATEGNVAFMNFDNTKGSIGRLPSWVRKLTGTSIVRYDVENDEIVRGDDGFCIPVGPGEAGEAIGKIPKVSKNATGRFEGYSDEEATKKKLLTDVFEKGDQYFRTGDLVRFDDNDYFFFVDRIGDTFRWKGENVATTEVAEVISVLPGIEEVNVYGVEIPGTDGRAGMASIVPTDDKLDLVKLYEVTEQDLAGYARPVFVRVQPEMEVTGTFKHRKVDLVKDGYDPSVIAEPVYFRDSSAGAYVEIDDALFQRINSGDVRI